MTPSERVELAIKQHPGATARAIGERVGLAGTSVTSHARSLERQGRVRIVRGTVQTLWPRDQNTREGLHAVCNLGLRQTPLTRMLLVSAQAELIARLLAK